ncbi:MAG: electron transfer flavoprotein-ubiquinone oxidoreductase [Planctomycetes bacterium]|nr:electron transfer flavoprotein-ubiquinone oxidoreductase [Planctomycetota bacterium]
MSTPVQYSLNVKGIERDAMPADVLLVGAGPANLACAIHLARLLQQKGIEGKSILVLEKAAEVGEHTLSGAVMNPKGIAALFPDWRERGCPVEADVTWDGFELMRSKTGSTRLTGALVPPQFKNAGKVIVSMNQVVQWMKAEAEKLGVQVFPGFPAAEILFETVDGVERVVGVQTRDSGVDKHGEQKGTFQAGMNITAPITVFGEGPRGHLAKHLVKRHKLDAGKNPQTYGTGIKEIWEIPAERGQEWLGRVLHTTGYPTGLDAYAGGWVYGMKENKLSIGFVIGLDHWDAKLDPHALFVQWKQHPAIAKLLEGGKVLRYGAKTVPEGGYFSMPRLYGDGYVLVGDTAGFLNASILKGVHLAIQSGMLAAEAIAEAVASNDASAAKLKRYDELFEASWAKEELYGVRNWRQAFEGGVVGGMLDVPFQMLTGGRGLVARRKGHADHTTTRPVSMSRFTKPVYDDSKSMDKLTDVYHSGTIHEEDQKPHLLVLDTSICVTRCTTEFGNPCQHFCPAAVYEWPKEGAPAPGKGPTINFSNCVHCKTCDIADPYENIEWVVPEGGGGPKYHGM